MISLRGIFPPPQKEPKKNFIKENVIKLRHMQTNRASNNVRPTMIKKDKPTVVFPTPEVTNEDPMLTDKISNSSITNKSNSILKNTSQTLPKQEGGKIRKADMSEFLRRKQNRESNTYPFTPKISVNTAVLNKITDQSKQCTDNISNFKDVGCQYTDPDATHFFSDGTKLRVIYPSKRITDVLDKKGGNKRFEMGDLKDKAEKVNDKLNKPGVKSKKELPGSANRVIPSRYMSNTNLNVNSQSNRSKTSLTSPLKLDPNFPPGQDEKNPLLPPPTYQKGVLPRYIKEAKKTERKKLDLEEMNDVDSQCPPGHITLPESERVETLKILREKFATLVSELNKMPVRTDTLRMRNRKMQLDKELAKLEEGIKVFSRPKVYVNIEV